MREMSSTVWHVTTYYFVSCHLMIVGFSTSGILLCSSICFITQMYGNLVGWFSFGAVVCVMLFLAHKQWKCLACWLLFKLKAAFNSTSFAKWRFYGIWISPSVNSLLVWPVLSCLLMMLVRALLPFGFCGCRIPSPLSVLLLALWMLVV